MPPKPINDKKIERGKRFLNILQFLYPRTSRANIGANFGGYAESALRKWESGSPLPNNVLNHLAEAGIDINWLLTGEGSMTREPSQPSMSMPSGLSPEKLREMARQLNELAEQLENTNE